MEESKDVAGEKLVDDYKVWNAAVVRTVKDGATERCQGIPYCGKEQVSWGLSVLWKNFITARNKSR